MQDEVRRWLKWIRLYEQTREVGLVCRRCGISPPTLRKWHRRYEERGEAGLIEQSRRPKHNPQRKVFEREDAWILALRRERNFGARRIQQELRRQHQFHLGLEAIHTVLKRHEVPPLRRPKCPQPLVRYSVALPGKRVQLDTMQLAPGVYQYTLVDGCTLYLVAAVYPRRKAANTLQFLEQALEYLPFPIQRLQTDNGTEFMAYLVRVHLLKRCIKHRPIPPGMPHLNDKVERAQQTMLTKFYSITPLEGPSLEEDLGVWLLDYNYRRVHGLLGKTPMQRWAELNEQTSFWEDVIAAFNSIKGVNYVDQLTLRRRRDISKQVKK